MSNVINFSKSIPAFEHAGARQRLRNAIMFHHTSEPIGDLDAVQADETQRFSDWVTGLTLEQRVTGHAKAVEALFRTFSKQMTEIFDMVKSHEIDRAFKATEAPDFLKTCSDLNLAIARWKWSLN